jgi:hypothetical protein
MPEVTEKSQEIIISQTAARAIEAYGGKEIWKKTRHVEAIASARGLAFLLKWQPPFNHIKIKTEVGKPYITLQPINRSGDTGILDGNLVRLEDSSGNILRERKNPREKFPYGRRLFWWDILDLVYFAGYAFWNYLTLPALLLRNDIEWTELAPGRLKACFPSIIPTHCPEQYFSFDPITGLLRQHDYTAEVMGGWAMAAHIVLEHERWHDIPYPSKRRVTPRHEDGTPAWGPTLIAIHIHEWSLE